MMKPSNPNAVWEIALSPGTYSVNWVAGDVAYADQLNNFNIEGTVVNDMDGQDNFDAFTATVTVTDGRLTLRPAAGASNAKINFIHITQTSALRTASQEGMKGLNVYPVPVSNQLTVALNADENENVEIELTDLSGKSVFASSYSMQAGPNEILIDVSKLNSGHYIVVIKKGSLTESKRIVISR